MTNYYSLYKSHYICCKTIKRKSTQLS